MGTEEAYWLMRWMLGDKLNVNYIFSEGTVSAAREETRQKMQSRCVLYAAHAADYIFLYEYRKAETVDLTCRKTMMAAL